MFTKEIKRQLQRTGDSFHAYPYQHLSLLVPPARLQTGCLYCSCSTYTPLSSCPRQVNKNGHGRGWWVCTPALLHVIKSNKLNEAHKDPPHIYTSCAPVHVRRSKTLRIGYTSAAALLPPMFTFLCLWFRHSRGRLVDMLFGAFSTCGVGLLRDTSGALAVDSRT